MNQTERFYKIDQLITERKVVSFQALLEELEISRATLRRDLEFMRSRLNAPIVYDRDANGYRFDGGPQLGDKYELPGLWFSPAEIHALLTMQHLLAGLDSGGILTPHIQPLMARLNALLGTADNSAEEVKRRVSVLAMGRRQVSLDCFERVGSALIGRKRLRIAYLSKGKGEQTEREVSPQRLVHYRENWYLDAWCHLRNELRSFALDSIQSSAVLEKPAKEMSARSLDEVLGPGYGIFSGKKVQWATLAFSPARARWVAKEQWHPRQKSRFDADGRYRLEVPYADHRELMMDILKYGADVEVLSPPELRRQVRQALAAAASLYD
ncbi:WYL domain-containing protein [Denitratisoma sp. agr-D3]